jgi:hypothetical protein
LSPNDILTEFNILNDNKTTKTKIVFNDETEERIYNLLLLEPLNVDEIALKL